MNIKTTTCLFALTLTLAASASAQVTSILPGGRGNLYIGTQATLPGPVPNIVISPRINLPAPLLTPTVALNLAPVPMAAAIPVLPVALPSAVPAIRVTASRENVALPGALQARFSAPSKETAQTKEVAAARELNEQREQLENLFDGRRAPKGTDDEFGPVRSGRHVSLPEHDLESEIGAY